LAASGELGGLSETVVGNSATEDSFWPSAGAVLEDCARMLSLAIDTKANSKANSHIDVTRVCPSLPMETPQFSRSEWLRL
jgi:hypothetical protein